MPAGRSGSLHVSVQPVGREKEGGGREGGRWKVGGGRAERERERRGERGTIEDQEEVKDEEKAMEDEKVAEGGGGRRGGGEDAKRKEGARTSAA